MPGSEFGNGRALGFALKGVGEPSARAREQSAHVFVRFAPTGVDERIHETAQQTPRRRAREGGPIGRLPDGLGGGREGGGHDVLLRSFGSADPRRFLFILVLMFLNLKLGSRPRPRNERSCCAAMSETHE